MRNISNGVKGSTVLGRLSAFDNTVTTVAGTDNINLLANGSGRVISGSDSVIENNSLFLENNSSQAIELFAPSSLSSSVTFTLPELDISTDSFLRTDASGNLSWDILQLPINDISTDPAVYNVLLSPNVSGNNDAFSVDNNIDFQPSNGRLSTGKISADITADQADINSGSVDSMSITSANKSYFVDLGINQGSESAPSLSPEISSNTGVYSPASGSVAFTIQGSDAVNLKSDVSDFAYQNLDVANTLETEKIVAGSSGSLSNQRSDIDNSFFGPATNMTGDGTNENRRYILAKQVDIVDDFPTAYLLGEYPVRNNVFGTISGQRSSGHQQTRQVNFGFSTTSSGGGFNCRFINAFEGLYRDVDWSLARVEVDGVEYNALLAENGALYQNTFAYFRGYIETNLDLETEFLSPQTNFSIVSRYGYDPTRQIRTDVSITGNLSKNSGSFKIDHPLPDKQDTHYLVHSFTESPGADLIYSGMVKLDQGRATVNIDSEADMTEGTFRSLCRDVRYFAKNSSGFASVTCSFADNQLTVQAESAVNDTVYWQVIGERQDREIRQSSATDDNGRFIVEPEKKQNEKD